MARDGIERDDDAPADCSDAFKRLDVLDFDLVDVPVGLHADQEHR